MKNERTAWAGMTHTLRRAALGVCMALAVGGAVLGLSGVRAGPALAAHEDDGALDVTDHFGYLAEDRIIYKWLPALMKATQQYSTNMMHQMWIVGSFFDAKHQMESHRLLQQMMNRVHKDYQPSDQLCRIGTNIRSLATTEERVKVNAQMISTILMNRELQPANSASGNGGRQIDKQARIRQFKRTYCDIHDNNDLLADMCVLDAELDGEDFTRGEPDERTNADIDFNRAANTLYTLDVDFTDTELTPTEEDILALGRNLFSHDVFTQISSYYLNREYALDDWQDARSLIAIRGLARDSFGQIIAQRSTGADEQGVAPYIKKLVLELGVPQDEIDMFLGEFPSYFAQMEVMTRKMFQNPYFYAQLYSKPANVKRTAVSLQAIKMIQDRDRFEASLRREMLLAGLLELKLRDAQDAYVNQIMQFQPFDREAPGGGVGAGPGAAPCTGTWLDCVDGP